MNTEQLRALAVAATPGPWLLDIATDSHDDCITAPRGFIVEGQIFSADNARYIAAVSPDVTIALLDENERLRERVKGLEADAKRYRFIRTNYDDSVVMVGGDKGCAELLMEDDLDAAIDAAMKDIGGHPV